MLQGARHVHMAALNAAAKDSGIEIEIHELRKATDLENAQPHALVFPGGESCLLYTSPSPRDRQKSRMPSSA